MNGPARPSGPIIMMMVATADRLVTVSNSVTVTATVTGSLPFHIPGRMRQSTIVFSFKSESVPQHQMHY